MTMDSISVSPAYSPPERPLNLAEYLWYVKTHERSIFVRRKFRDKWRTVALSELPPNEWGAKIAGWIEEGHIPARLLEPNTTLSHDRRRAAP